MIKRVNAEYQGSGPRCAGKQRWAGAANVVGSGVPNLTTNSSPHGLGVNFQASVLLACRPKSLGLQQDTPFPKGREGTPGNTRPGGGLCLRAVHRPGTGFSRTEPPLLAPPPSDAPGSLGLKAGPGVPVLPAPRSPLPERSPAPFPPAPVPLAGTVQRARPAERGTAGRAGEEPSSGPA